MNPRARIYGLDWTQASQAIVRELIARGELKNAAAHNFNFFAPDPAFTMLPGAVAYTVAALEQVGERFTEFCQYLLQQKPALCVHIEPIAELLDSDNLLDYLSIEYFRVRKYLWGFLPYLQGLEAAGKIHLHAAQRTFLGGNMHVDHYSVVVWSPR